MIIRFLLLFLISAMPVLAEDAAVRVAVFGSGRVLCFSPHPEMTDGLRHLSPIAVDRFAAEKK